MASVIVENAVLIAMSFLGLLMVRTTIEIIRLKKRAEAKAMVQFYIKALLIAGLAFLCVVFLHRGGLDTVAVALAAMTIVALGLWKIFVRNH